MGWTMRKAVGALVAAVFAFGLLCPPARADSTVEVSGATGLGVVVVGVTPGRFARSPWGPRPSQENYRRPRPAEGKRP
jgi:hypothetical protein